MAITALPSPPSTTDPTNFATKADAFIAALPQFVIEANALGNVGSPVSSNYLSGLTLSTAGASATFGIAIGQAADAANAIMMALGSAYTKTTSAWALGTGNGAMDTGTVAASTWYHVYLIQRPDTLVTDVLFSLNVSAPTMPANYTRKRRVGSMKTNGSSQWVKFLQIGDEFLWDAMGSDFSTAALTTSALTIGPANVPTGVKVDARIRGYFLHASAATALLLTSFDESDQAVDVHFATAQISVAAQAVNFVAQIRTDTSAQMRARSNAASSTLWFAAYGWRDDRGKP
jgi:hypothetical protein